MFRLSGIAIGPRSPTALGAFCWCLLFVNYSSLYAFMPSQRSQSLISNMLKKRFGVDVRGDVG